MPEARVPRPIFPPDEDFTWQEKAACKHVNPSVFFPVDAYGRLHETEERVAEAKAICAECPVCDVCAEYAVRVNEKAGVWGRLTTRERRRVRKAAAATEGAP